MRARALLQAVPVPLRSELESLIPELAVRKRAMLSELAQIDGWPADSKPFLTPAELRAYAAPFHTYACVILTTSGSQRRGLLDCFGSNEIRIGGYAIDPVEIADLRCIDQRFDWTIRRVAKNQRPGTSHTRSP